MDAIGDVIIVMVCLENSNPIDDVSYTNMPLLLVFHDHKSKYAVTQSDVKKKNTRKIIKVG